MVHVRCQERAEAVIATKKGAVGQRARMLLLFRGLVVKCGGHNRLRSRLGCSGEEGLCKDTLSVSLC